MYHNYHKHDHYGNPWVMDVAVKPRDYCQRAVELGHKTVFTTNHGVTGNIFEWLELSKEYGLKMVYGTEAYYVDNFEEKERGRHLIVIAKNNDGVMQLNDIMSSAHMEGFYYVPRINRELLFSLEPKNFVVTSACVAGIWQDRELLLALNQKFKGNFFLELQNHNFALQKELNKELLALCQVAHIPIIHANDSHYISPSDTKYRDILLTAKGHKYDNEDEMILDYPSEDEIYRRYEKQGILTRAQVAEALENTNIFDECESITLINDDIKLPSVADNPTKALLDLIRGQWEIEKHNIPKSKWKEYEDAINYEFKIIRDTHMENYFLIDYIVAKNGQEKYGGKLTNTGRGSAPSFYTTKLLGLTDIDRISAPITLFPTRFMSVERILGSRSLPDIDLNMADREPFIKATEDLLGKENCAWMLTWKPLQDSSAFRVYCKGIGKDISEYDEVAKNLSAYEDDKKWAPIIEESKILRGVIESVSESPCSMLLYYKPVRQELGLVRTNAGVYCCLLDGINCDKYKYLKNDYLSVTVWSIIRSVCELAEIPIPTIRELDKLLDDKAFEIYEKGLTCTINQADSDFATELVKRYKPKSVSEMSAFVAIIRPGCAKLLQDFVDRKPYTTGVAALDELLIEGNHRMIYQELIMKYLIWLGIPETGSYDIIKKISKKKFKEAELTDLRKKLAKGWLRQVQTSEGFEGTWAIVQDAARYSFNSSHSLSYAYDSLYGAYLKSHYPLEYYTVALNYYSDDSERTLKLTNELSYFGISLKPIKFRYSKGDYTLFREENSIYKGIQSIKDMNAKVADDIYGFRNNTYNNFTKLLTDINEKTTANSKQIKILIELDFFEEFGESNKLLSIFEFYHKYKKRTTLKKEELTNSFITLDDVRECSGKETDKQFSQVDFTKLLSLVENKIPYKPKNNIDKIKAQIQYLGYVDFEPNPNYKGLLATLEVDTKYSPKLKMYSLKTGKTLDFKINKRTFKKNPIEKGDVILVQGHKVEPRKKMIDGKFVSIPGTSERWITQYKKVDSI